MKTDSTPGKRHPTLPIPRLSDGRMFANVLQEKRVDSDRRD